MKASCRGALEYGFACAACDRTGWTRQPLVPGATLIEQSPPEGWVSLGGLAFCDRHRVEIWVDAVAAFDAFGCPVRAGTTP